MYLFICLLVCCLSLAHSVAIYSDETCQSLVKIKRRLVACCGASHECWVKLSYPEICPLIEFEVVPIHPDLGLSFWLVRFLLQSVTMKPCAESLELLHNIQMCVRMIQLLCDHWQLLTLQMSPLKQALFTLMFQILSTINVLVKEHRSNLMTVDIQDVIDKGLEVLKELNTEAQKMFEVESKGEVTTYFQLLMDMMVLADKLRSSSCKQVSKVSFGIGGVSDEEEEDKEDATESDTVTEWDCPACTLKNPFAEDKCGLCGASRPPLKPKAKRDTKGMNANKLLQQLIGLSSAIEYFKNIDKSNKFATETLFKGAWNILKQEDDPTKQWFLISNVPPGPDDKVIDLLRHCVSRIESDNRVSISHIYLGTDPQAKKPITRKRKFVQKYIPSDPNLKEWGEKGIVHFIATNGKARAWKNPMDDGLVQVRVKGLALGSSPANSIVSNKSVRCMTKSELHSYVVVDFGERRVCPSFYKLRHYSFTDRDALRFWRLEGCAENCYSQWAVGASATADIDSDSKWEVLCEHSNDELLKKAGDIGGWKIESNQPKRFFHKFRVIITGVNSSNNFVLALSGFEVYGHLEMPPTVAPTKQKTHRFAVVEVGNPSVEVSQALLSMSGMAIKAPSGTELEYVTTEKEPPLPSPRQLSTPAVTTTIGILNAAIKTTPEPPRLEDLMANIVIPPSEERFVVDSIESELQVKRFSELPDGHILKDVFLKDLFLVSTQNDRNQHRVRPSGDSGRELKDKLQDHWRELFQKKLIGEGLTREEFVKMISPTGEGQDLILSICEQFDIQDNSQQILWDQFHDIVVTLIKVNPKIALNWIFVNGYDHRGSRRFDNNFDNAWADQMHSKKSLGFNSLQQLKPIHVRHVSEEEVQSDSRLRELLNLKAEMPIETLRLRLSAFQILNMVISKTLAFIDLSRYEMPSSLAHMLCIVGDEYIFTKMKTDFLQNVMDATSEAVEKKPVVRMNRMRLLNKLSTVGTLDFATESNFGFGYQQLSRVDESQLRPPKPQGADPFVAFVLDLIGQFVEGDTGPYRQYFNDVSSELQSPESYLFQLTPNGRKPQLDLMNKDKYVIRPSHPNLLLSATQGTEESNGGIGGADKTKQGVREGLNIQSAKDSANLKEEQFGMFEFLGKLIGMCLRTGVKLNLSLPAFFWKPLVGVSCGQRDLYEIDTTLCKGLEEIWNYPVERKHEFENEVKETFMTTLSDMTLVELKPNGSDIPVTFENRREYVSLVYQVRLNEHMPHVECIRQGIHKIVPIHLLTLFTWEELERLICGIPDINIDLLRRHTIYDKAIDPNSEYIEWFWKILHEFSPENKRKFIRFTWAQERLPNNDEEFTRLRLRFLIKPVIKSVANIDQSLPKAHTCFFHLELPKYSTKEIMKERLLLAITESLSMNADEPGRDDLNQAMQIEDAY
ncbi:HECT domain and RCC1-like domain-containing protein [Reticulomyxa filosa]|uniref:HECT domain and RCC1-like domain-containing protein n=1 Tax=Reticulomyxa filosa TaxID=46433 RepID=X6P0N7_RETFI|nr:HECT domain and RCC1-like domain-containing protein [Reticulomyxa filosa]|eukprot:ETO31097.1 HECT domain and RCC1-like domain-containing protein [Reticulomyxa filosa]